MGAIEKQRIQSTISWQGEKKNLELFFFNHKILVPWTCGCPVSPHIYEKADSLLLLPGDDSVPACQFGGKDEQSHVKTAVVLIHSLLHGLECAGELVPTLPFTHMTKKNVWRHFPSRCCSSSAEWWAPHSGLSLGLSWPRQKVSSAEDGKTIN